jgi:hypothetical protein
MVILGNFSMNTKNGVNGLGKGKATNSFYLYITIFAENTRVDFRCNKVLMSVMHTELVGKSLGAHIGFDIEHKTMDIKCNCVKRICLDKGECEKDKANKRFIRLAPSAPLFTEDFVASAQRGG